jgi:hypothetical protein
MTQKKLFVSYRSVNRAEVNGLVQNLERMAFNVWYDQELTGAQRWWNNILHNIRECDVFLIALTEEYLDSEACRREYTYAHALNRYILPVKMGEVNYGLLPLILQERQIIDFTQADKIAALTHLVGSIQVLPPALPLPNPLPAEPDMPISPLASVKESIEKQTLTQDEQYQILFRLKGYINNPPFAKDARALLEHLSRHPSLYAIVLHDIQDVLNPPAPAARESAQPTGEQQTGETIYWRGRASIGSPEPLFDPKGELVVTNTRLVFSPIAQDRKMYYRDIPLTDVIGVKKHMYLRLNPAIQIDLVNQTFLHFQIFNPDGSWGNREEFIAAVEKAKQG